MAQSLSETITRSWYEGAVWLHLLRPFSALFALIVKMRQFLYRSGAKKRYTAPVPVIVVGNITVGGAGKSPLVSYLVNQFQAQGYAPGVVSRGYGASQSTTTATLVNNQSRPQVVGDEPLMLSQKLACPVAVCAQRELAIKLLLAEGCDLIVADDGLQHLAMDRDIELCVFDSKRLWGNGRLLPSGPLREPLTRLQSINYLILNGGAPDASVTLKQPYLSMSLKPENLRALNGEEHQALSALSGQKVHAVAGIGNPERFFSTLEAHGLSLHRHAFADHYDYSLADFESLQTFPIIMTEKDAVKCRGLGLKQAWYLPVEAQLDDNLALRIINDLKASGRLAKGLPNG